MRERQEGERKVDGEVCQVVFHAKEEVMKSSEMEAVEEASHRFRCGVER